MSANKKLSYRGNMNLKRTGVPVNWTSEMIKEWVKCESDPIYFCEKYIKIIDADGNMFDFKPYPYQKEIILSYFQNRNTITVTARQAGKTTTTCAFLLWYVTFNETKTAVILANKEDVAIEILGRVQFAYEYLPKWMQHGIKEWNKKSLIFENGSKIYARATSKSAIRGFTVNFLFIDEVAQVENWKDFYTSSSETLAQGKNTKLALVSTPLGLNHFWEIYSNAIEKKNGFHPIKVTWQSVPGRDEKWKQEALGRLNHDEERFRQEHCCEFLGSSGTLIAGWKLQQLKSQIPLTDTNNFKEYVKPQKNHVYAIVADVSEGKGFDYNAFSVIDITTLPYNQVAVFHDNFTSPIEYTEIIHRVATAYNKAAVLIENNINMGGQIADSLHYDYEYEHVLHTENAGAAGKRVTVFGRSTERGIRTTKTVKAVGCSMLKLLIEQNKLVINDASTIYELSTFSRKGKSFEAEEGKYDDLVMGLVLFAWLSNQEYFKELNDINTLSKLREKSQEQIMDELTPFGYIDNGIDDIDASEETWIETENWIFGHDFH